MFYYFKNNNILLFNEKQLLLLLAQQKTLVWMLFYFFNTIAHFSASHLETWVLSPTQPKQIQPHSSQEHIQATWLFFSFPTEHTVST